MNLFIGIDGGGTRTRCVLVNYELNVLSKAEGKATNPLVVGFDESANTLLGLIKKVLDGKVRHRRIDSTVIGIAGCARKTSANKLKKKIFEKAEQKNVLLRRLEIISDAEIAIEGAFSGKAGAILIAGTGSIIFGKDIKGNFIRAGGFGKLIGDEGSGYSIGRKGLAVVAKEFDGRGKKTLLTKILGEKLGINNRDNLITKVYNKQFDTASVAQDVIAAASKGDKICRKILNEEINELLLHIKALKKNFDEKKIKLAFSGGLISSKNYYSKELRRKIKKTFKNIELKKAIHTPEIGAALLAIKSSPSE